MHIWNTHQEIQSIQNYLNYTKYPNKKWHNVVIFGFGEFKYFRTKYITEETREEVFILVWFVFYNMKHVFMFQIIEFEHGQNEKMKGAQEVWRVG